MNNHIPTFDSFVNESMARIKPFNRVKKGDIAEVLGSSDKWIVLATGTGKEFDKVLKKFDESGIVADMKKRPDNYGLEDGDFEELDLIAVKSPRGESSVYTYDFDGAFVAA